MVKANWKKNGDAFLYQNINQSGKRKRGPRIENFEKIQRPSRHRRP